MRIAKRIFLFVTVNILILASISLAISALGIAPYLSAQGINYASLMTFCLLWGFGGAFISLALSRTIAKWTMGVELITRNELDPELRALKMRVHELSRSAGLEVMPEVGVYESDEPNAFATGPSRQRSLVAVSTKLLESLDSHEVEGVLAHEVAHIANGDMVTMTLLQGVINAFVMFVARVAGFFVSQLADEERRPAVQFGVVLVSEIVLGCLGMLVSSAFSRAREFRADSRGAQLSSHENMIAALEALKRNYDPRVRQVNQPALASLKISGSSGGLLRLLSTHPELDVRIERLREEAQQESRKPASEPSGRVIYGD